MTLLSLASPAIKVLFERVGKPEVIDRPHLLSPGGAGAVIVCNHVGWADSLWMAYAVYPRQLRYMSKKELFASPISRWVLVNGGSIPIDRTEPSPSSIKSAVEALRNGEILLIFPSGTRSGASTSYKRGAATIALHAQVPIVPALYIGPSEMHFTHLVGRPRIQVRFGPAIPTEGLDVDKATASTLTLQLRDAIEALRFDVVGQSSAA